MCVWPTHTHKACVCVGNWSLNYFCIWPPKCCVCVAHTHTQACGNKSHNNLCVCGPHTHTGLCVCGKLKFELFLQYKIMQGGILCVICTCRMNSPQKSFCTNEGLLTNTIMFVLVSIIPSLWDFWLLLNKGSSSRHWSWSSICTRFIFLTLGQMSAVPISLWTNLTSVTFYRCNLKIS